MLDSGNKVSPARRAAHAILTGVSGGGYASDLLLRETAALSTRDAGLASQLVFGCLRYQGQLDYLIRHYSGRQIEQVEEPVRILLRLGIYQLRYLDRIPPHAAVDDTVELAKRRRRAAAGFVNAVLRKVRRGPVAWPDRATALSCPEWLLARWSRQFGAAQAEAIARAALTEPEQYIRVPASETPPPGIDLAATDVAGCYRVTGGDTRGLRFQDIGSQAIVPFLELAPGLTLLDLCAAPGNKILQALETPVRAVACDISGRRAREIPAVCPRVILDATRPLPFGRKFDRVFIDAPCSGTGTLARNPEIKWRVQEQDLARHRERQTKILQRGLEWLAPGGRLIYATCSLENEENGEAVRGGAAAYREVEIRDEISRLPGRDEGDGFYVAVLTSEHPVLARENPAADF